MGKDYKSWFNRQKVLNEREFPPTFYYGQIWWCEIGANVGDEICGEGEDFVKPVLILQKYTKFLFLGAPLSEEEADSNLPIPIEIYGKKYIVLLDQVRSYDARRLRQKFAKYPISKRKFNDIRKVLMGSF